MSITESARHIASPLPSGGPNSGTSVASWWTSAPARAATSAVPSAEPASTTITASMTLRSRRSSRDSTMAPIVPAVSRAGTHTVTVSVFASAVRSGE